jgi:hypothetical protein
MGVFVREKNFYDIGIAKRREMKELPNIIDTTIHLLVGWDCPLYEAFQLAFYIRLKWIVSLELLKVLMKPEEVFTGRNGDAFKVYVRLWS